MMFFEEIDLRSFSIKRKNLSGDIESSIPQVLEVIDAENISGSEATKIAKFYSEG